MRVPQPKTYTRSARATQPSTPPSNIHSTGPQGTPGGKARKPGVAGRRSLKMGTYVYLWILVAIEMAIIVGLRKYFRRRHGG